MRRAGVVRAVAAVTTVALLAAGLGGGVAGASGKTIAPRASASGSVPAGGPPVPQIVPKPVSMQVGDGWFTLTSRARIAVSGGPAATAVAQDLAADLRPATGYTLPIVSGAGGPGEISLALTPRATIAGDPDGEGYRLVVTPREVRLTAATAH